MIQYGLISSVDSACLEKTIDLICNEFTSGLINVTEIGIYAGQTMKGIVEYVGGKGRSLNTTGIDNWKDGQDLIFSYYSKIIKGNSSEVYNQLEDNSQHLCFVDGCHCFAHVVSDFFCYAPKVKVGGYFAFHDTGRHIKEFKDFQHGDKTNPDAYISVRKALDKIGLLDLKYFYDSPTKIGNKDWELIFDEADETNPAGGVCVFRKM